MHPQLLPWVVWVVNLLLCVMEDCRPVRLVQELVILNDLKEASLPHCSVPDDHQLPAFTCHPAPRLRTE